MNSIMRFAAALTMARRAYPQLRIGQIISNAVSLADGSWSDGDAFYYQDDALVRAIERYAERDTQP